MQPMLSVWEAAGSTVPGRLFDRADGRQMLEEWGVKGDYEGIGFCILGFAAKEGKAAPRKSGRVYYVK